MYQSMVGSLFHAARATRPDIAHAVGTVSKFNSTPTEVHMKASKWIFHYLKGTVDLSLRYHATGEKLYGYSDADWASDADDRYSTSGNVLLMAGGAISWLSQKQTTVALSTAEAEYMALGSATQETIWLRHLLSDLQVNTDYPTEIFEDNQGAIAMAKNPIGHNCLLVYVYTNVYLSLLVFTYVYNCLTMFTNVYSCLLMFARVYLCLPMFTTV